MPTPPMAHAAQHGATEGRDVSSYRTSSALEFNVHGEIFQSDVLLDPQMLDFHALAVESV